MQAQHIFTGIGCDKKFIWPGDVAPHLSAASTKIEDPLTMVGTVVHKMLCHSALDDFVVLVAACEAVELSDMLQIYL